MHLVDGCSLGLLVDCVYRAYDPAVRSSIVASIQTQLDSLGGPQHLIGALSPTSDQYVVGYVLHYPGRIAMLSGPALVARSPLADGAEHGSPETLGTPVDADAVIHWIRSLSRAAAERWDLALIQATVEEEDQATARWLAAADYRALASLTQMRLGLSEFDASDRPNQEDVGRWRQDGEADRAAYERWMEATYIDTFDCPQMADLRSTADVWEGYWAASDGPSPRLYAPDVTLPQWWSTRDASGDIIAACLLTPIATAAWELLYLGVASSHRSQGWGRRGLRWAIEQTRRLGGEELYLCVDTANTPGIQLYESEGFVATRQVQSWYWRPST